MQFRLKSTCHVIQNQVSTILAKPLYLYQFSVQKYSHSMNAEIGKKQVEQQKLLSKNVRTGMCGEK